jgi:hypothetical protein
MVSPDTTVSYANKTDRQNITEILLKVELSTVHPSIVGIYGEVCLSH